MLARIAAAGAHTGFEYGTEVVPSNCLPGATEYVPRTGPWRCCSHTDLVRDLHEGMKNNSRRYR